MQKTLNHGEARWSQVWNEQLLLHRKTHPGEDVLRQWEGRECALRYWRSCRDSQRERIQGLMQDLDLHPGSRVLDIGAGPGVLAIPLSRRVAHLTAVDASSGMIQVLREKARERGVDNIRCVHKRWEDVVLPEDLSPPYDVVLASLSLDMLDIHLSIQKMEKASSRHVYLFWFTGEPSWETHARELFPSLHGIQYTALPKCELLLRILDQMGIRPAVTVLPYLHVERFQDLEEAMSPFRRRYRVTTDRQEAVLRDYVSSLLEPQGPALLLRSPAAFMKVHWQVR
jgi:SAM-dependent methyltransferase